jgi:Protein of unknown function (DUF1499)
MRSIKIKSFNTITRWGAIACLVMILLSSVFVRLLNVPFKVGLLMFILGSIFAMLLLVTLVIASFMPRWSGQRSQLLPSMVIVLVSALIFITLIFGRGNYPSTHNISTDTYNPPEFIAAYELRGSESNPLVYTEEVAELQRTGYSDLASLHSDLPSGEAFIRSRAIANKLGWNIHESDITGGHIEAVDTTFWFGFKDDIVIRVLPNGSGSVIDLRSVSRIGGSDHGANAARIRKFIATFKDA